MNKGRNFRMARDKEKKEGTDEWMRSPGECGEEKGGDVGV